MAIGNKLQIDMTKNRKPYVIKEIDDDDDDNENANEEEDSELSEERKTERQDQTAAPDTEAKKVSFEEPSSSEVGVPAWAAALIQEMKGIKGEIKEIKDTQVKI